MATAVRAAGQAVTKAPTPATPRAMRAASDTAQMATTASTACRLRALAQDEGVLGADGDDEGEAGAETGQGRCGDAVVHGSDRRQRVAYEYS